MLALLLVLVWLAALEPVDPRGLGAETLAAETRLRPVRGLARARLAVVVLAPVFLGRYYLWVLPVFAVSLGALWQDRLERPLAVVATVACFATLPEGYSLGPTTTVVGVPIALVVLVLLLAVVCAPRSGSTGATCPTPTVRSCRALITDRRRLPTRTCGPRGADTLSR